MALFQTVARVNAGRVSADRNRNTATTAFKWRAPRTYIDMMDSTNVKTAATMVTSFARWACGHMKAVANSQMAMSALKIRVVIREPPRGRGLDHNRDNPAI